jgi:hypothetical protein
MRLRSAPALVVCALIGLAVPSSASAAPDGAQVTHVRQCEVFEFGTLCTNEHIVSSFVPETRGGTEVHVGNRHYEISLEAAGPLSGACSFVERGQQHFRFVFTPHGGIFGDVLRTELRSFVGCTGGALIICDSVLQAHVVNFVLVIDRFDFKCREEADEPAA